MSVIVPVLRAIVREELPGVAGGGLQLGVVTAVATNSGGAGDHDLEVGVRIRGSATELQRVPVCTSRIGISAVPRVGDLVVLGFIAGDLDGALVLGVLHTDAEQPPDAEPDEVVYEVPDPGDGGKRRLELLLPNGNKVTVKDSLVVVSIGGTILQLDGDKVTIEATGGVEISTDGDLDMSAMGNISMSAMGNAELSAMGNLTLKGAAAGKLSAAAVTIAGNVSFSPG